MRVLLFFLLCLSSGRLAAAESPPPATTPKHIGYEIFSLGGNMMLTRGGDYSFFPMLSWNPTWQVGEDEGWRVRGIVTLTARARGAILPIIHALGAVAQKWSEFELEEGLGLEVWSNPTQIGPALVLGASYLPADIGLGIFRYYVQTEVFFPTANPVYHVRFGLGFHL